MVEKVPLRKAIAKLNFPTIVAFGNPFVDHYVRTRNKDLLEKYNLEVDRETELPEEKLQKLMLDLPLESEYGTSAEGSALNSMRILQWLCDETFQKQYSIGRSDDRASFLRYLVQSAGVDGSLETSIGAGGVYTLEDLKRSQLLFHTIKIIYIEWFFVTHSFPVAEQIVKRAEERDIIIAFNLSGTYIFNDHHLAMCKLIGYANIVFVSVSNTLNANWVRHGRVFVMSQGESAPAIAVWGKSQSVQVQPIKPTAPVIDTAGAGDGLVAGFLAGVLAQWSPKHCLEYGCKVASFLVTRHGVVLPENVPPDLLE
ncbi:Adenosine kinase [Anthophora retusa]